MSFLRNMMGGGGGMPDMGELGKLLGGLGGIEVDTFNLEQGKIPFPLLGRTNHAFDSITGTQAQTSDLGRGDIDVVGPGQVVVVWRAEETEAVGQGLQDALAVDLLPLVGQGLEQLPVI